MILKSEIAGVILAGGKASRMGYLDKALLKLHDRPLIEYVLATARKQVGELTISVNRNPHKYRYLGLPLIADCHNQYAGPLVGIYSAMQWVAKTRKQTRMKYLACFAADVPWFPSDLVAELASQLLISGSEVAWCTCAKQVQPLFSLWSLDTRPVIESAIASGIYGPKLVMPQLKNVLVEIQAHEPGYFFNINSLAALEVAKKMRKNT
ncbi:MAG: molybdenum cofactor guanylyltransferase [Proteobacteria bacterium]|nr:molybdenum cofactor guanylyltransferase [Pseudomonadota bacterium]